MGIKDFIVVIAVALVWTLTVVAFSTTMGARPLRIYDWGPPVLACVITVLVMIRDKTAGRE